MKFVHLIQFAPADCMALALAPWGLASSGSASTAPAVLQAWGTSLLADGTCRSPPAHELSPSGLAFSVPPCPGEPFSSRYSAEVCSFYYFFRSCSWRPPARTSLAPLLRPCRPPRAGPGRVGPCRAVPHPAPPRRRPGPAGSAAGGGRGRYPRPGLRVPRHHPTAAILRPAARMPSPARR